MKVTKHERVIQGGVPCKLCGASDPCGNIYDCGWWAGDTDYVPRAPQATFAETARKI